MFPSLFFDDVLVDAIVEVVHAPVERLPSVVWIRLSGNADATGAGEDEQREHQQSKQAIGNGRVNVAISRASVKFRRSWRLWEIRF